MAAVGSRRQPSLRMRYSAAALRHSRDGERGLFSRAQKVQRRCREGAESSPEQVGVLLERQVPTGAARAEAAASEASGTVVR